MLDEEVDDAVSRVAGVLKEAGAKRVFSFCPSTQTPFSDNIPTLTNPANSSHQKHHIEEAVIQSEKNVQNRESVEGLIESTKSSPSDNNTSMVMEIQSSDNATLSLAEEKKNKKNKSSSYDAYKKMQVDVSKWISSDGMEEVSLR